jgi:L-idonate 5-dehydrogenase
MRAAVLFGKHDLRLENVGTVVPPAGEVTVRVAYGGICGSDLSYFHKGRVGDFAVKEPMVLGHEVAGVVTAVGEGVTSVRVGTRIAVNPSRACLHCDYCRAGRSNLCRNMRFLGSAAVSPHVQGGFTEQLLVREDQCVAIPDTFSLRLASCAEPLSVALHAARQAGSLLGKKVLVSGAGPIGLMCALTALKAGAAEVHSSDLVDAPLRTAKELGVTATYNVTTQASQLEAFAAGKGYFDVALEASGAPQALAGHFRLVRPGGRIVQLGMLPPGDAAVPINVLQSRELELLGSFRAHEEFNQAVQVLVDGQFNVEPILSAEFPLDRVAEAFEMAGDRTRALKVLIAVS